MPRNLGSYSGPGILLASSGPPPANTKKFARLLADTVIQGLTAAPNRTPDVPCLVILPMQIHHFMGLMQEIAQRPTKPTLPKVPSSPLRSDYSALLDAIVAFANSSWAPEEKERFESCNCHHHEAREIKSFQDAVYIDGRGHCAGSGPLHETVIAIFMILADVVSDIVAHPGEVVRLERNPSKRGAWPSSPSKLIPNGASNTLVAFMKWALLIENPMPPHSLAALSSLCPSLESEMSQSEEIVPLVALLFSKFFDAIQDLNIEQTTPNRRKALKQDIGSFYSLITNTWFENQSVGAETTGNKKIVAALVSIYNDLCKLISLIGQSELYPTFQANRMNDRLGAVGVSVYCHLSTVAPVPLRDILVPYAHHAYSRHAEVTVFNTDIINLRHQIKCAYAPCNQTVENAKRNFRFCSACHSVRYCSKVCQSGDWQSHKPVCKFLGVLVPISFTYRSLRPLETQEELVARFFAQIKEAGLTEGDFYNVREYVLSHITRRTLKQIPLDKLGEFPIGH